MIKFPSSRHCLYSPILVDHHDGTDQISPGQIVPLMSIPTDILEKLRRFAKTASSEDEMIHFYGYSTATVSKGKNPVLKIVLRGRPEKDEGLKVSIFAQKKSEDGYLHFSDEQRNLFIQGFRDCCNENTKISVEKFFTINLLTCLEDDMLHIMGEVLMPSMTLHMDKIQSLPIYPSELTQFLQRKKSTSKQKSSGFLTMDKTRKVILLLENDEMACNLPLVGIWVSGVDSHKEHYVWAAVMRYVHSNVLQERVYYDDRSFLILVYSKVGKPYFVLCTIDGTLHEFMSYTCVSQVDDIQNDIVLQWTYDQYENESMIDTSSVLDSQYKANVRVLTPPPKKKSEDKQTFDDQSEALSQLGITDSLSTSFKQTTNFQKMNGHKKIVERYDNSQESYSQPDKSIYKNLHISTNGTAQKENETNVWQDNINEQLQKQFELQNQRQSEMFALLEESIQRTLEKEFHERLHHLREELVEHFEHQQKVIFERTQTQEKRYIQKIAELNDQITELKSRLDEMRESNPVDKFSFPNRQENPSIGSYPQFASPSPKKPSPFRYRNSPVHTKTHTPNSTSKSKPSDKPPQQPKTPKIAVTNSPTVSPHPNTPNVHDSMPRIHYTPDRSIDTSASILTMSLKMSDDSTMSQADMTPETRKYISRWNIGSDRNTSGSDQDDILRID